MSGGGRNSGNGMKCWMMTPPHMHSAAAAAVAPETRPSAAATVPYISLPRRSLRPARPSFHLAVQYGRYDKLQRTRDRFRAN